MAGEKFLAECEALLTKWRRLSEMRERSVPTVGGMATRPGNTGPNQGRTYATRIEQNREEESRCRTGPRFGAATQLTGVAAAVIVPIRNVWHRHGTAGEGSMFDSTVLDVAVGLIFTFLTVSLVCGLLTETWATIMSWRANTLLAGVQAMVNDPHFTKLAKTLYQHAQVSAQDSGTAETVADLKKLPAYIAPLQFADALLDTVKIGAGTAASMQTAIANSPL